MAGSRAAVVASAIFEKPAESTGEPGRRSALALRSATERTVCSSVPARASRTWIWMPSAFAACSTAITWAFPVSGSQSTAIRRSPGSVVLSSSRSLPEISGRSRNIPVMFPPGLASVATNPAGHFAREVPRHPSKECEDRAPVCDTLDLDPSPAPPSRRGPPRLRPRPRCRSCHATRRRGAGGEGVPRRYLGGISLRPIGSSSVADLPARLA